VVVEENTDLLEERERNLYMFKCVFRVVTTKSDLGDRIGKAASLSRVVILLVIHIDN
jgi:hypothetical protein